MQTPPQEVMNTKKSIRVIQQPKIAKSCMFADRHRKPIDPCPVVELVVDERYKNTTNYFMETPFLVCSATLLSEDTTQLCQFIRSQDDDTIEQNLIGSHIVPGMALQGADQMQSFFFIFSDLSVRLEGSYRIRFDLIDLSGPFRGVATQLTTSTSNIIASAVSAPFTVVNSHRFTGPLESTDLTKSFAKQGIRLPIRNSTNRRKLKTVDNLSEE